MANHKSSKKRIRQTKKRQLINKRVKSSLRTAEKNLCISINKKDKIQTLKQFQSFKAAIDQCIKKGTYHKNKVNRKKSSLANRINNM